MQTRGLPAGSRWLWWPRITGQGQGGCVSVGKRWDQAQARSQRFQCWSRGCGVSCPDGKRGKWGAGQGPLFPAASGPEGVGPSSHI